MATSSQTLVAASGRAYVTLTSWAGDAVFPVTPVSGDQIEHPTGLTVGADGAVTGADGTYTLRLVDASTGTVYGISYEIGAGGGGGAVDVTTSATLIPYNNHAVVTLAEGFDTYLFQEWTEGTPAVGWQLVYPTNNNTVINNLGELQTDATETFDIWAVNTSGQWYGLTLNPGEASSESAPTGTLTFGTPVAGSNSITQPWSWSGQDATGFEFRINAGAWGEASNPISLQGLLSETQYTIEIRAYNSVGATSEVSTQVTTLEAAAPPEGEAVTTAISRPRIKVMGKVA